jgi:hypothetical protein
MKMGKGIEAKVHIFLTSPLVGDWSDSHYSHYLTPEKKNIQYP